MRVFRIFESDDRHPFLRDACGRIQVDGPGNAGKIACLTQGIPNGSCISRAGTADRRNEIIMSQLLRISTSIKRDPTIEVWMHEHSGELGKLARRWFEVMRDCGDDVRELLHDGHPTACAGDAAFAYLNAYKAHVNVGFFRGAELPDPLGLLEGTGKFMRHVKLGPERDVDDAALLMLIETAYRDMKARL